MLSSSTSSASSASSPSRTCRMSLLSGTSPEAQQSVVDTNSDEGCSGEEEGEEDKWGMVTRMLVQRNDYYWLRAHRRSPYRYISGVCVRIVCPHHLSAAVVTANLNQHFHPFSLTDPFLRSTLLSTLWIPQRQMKVLMMAICLHPIPFVLLQLAILKRDMGLR